MGGSKHDADCLRRKEDPAMLYVCTCGLADEQVKTPRRDVLSDHSGCGVSECPCNDGDPCNYENHGETRAMPHPDQGSRPRVIMVEGVPWVSHEFHQRCLDEARAEARFSRTLRTQAIINRIREASSIVGPDEVARTRHTLDRIAIVLSLEFARSSDDVRVAEESE